MGGQPCRADGACCGSQTRAPNPNGMDLLAPARSALAALAGLRLRRIPFAVSQTAQVKSFSPALARSDHARSSFKTIFNPKRGCITSHNLIQLFKSGFEFAIRHPAKALAHGHHSPVNAGLIDKIPSGFFFAPSRLGVLALNRLWDFYFRICHRCLSVFIRGQ